MRRLGLHEALCFAGGQAAQPLRPLAVTPGARMYAYAMASPHEEDITVTVTGALGRGVVRFMAVCGS